LEKMSYKSRKYRFKKRAARILKQVGYEPIFPQNEMLFDIIAIHKKHIRYIAISLDKPGPELIGRVRAIQKPGQKEIWYRGDDNQIETICF